jgi:hypothetical protein
LSCAIGSHAPDYDVNDIILSKFNKRKAGSPSRNTCPKTNGRGRIINKDATQIVLNTSGSTNSVPNPSTGNNNIGTTKQASKKTYSTIGTNAVKINAMIVLNMVFI